MGFYGIDWSPAPSRFCGYSAPQSIICYTISWHLCPPFFSTSHFPKTVLYIYNSEKIPQELPNAAKFWDFFCVLCVFSDYEIYLYHCDWPAPSLPLSQWLHRSTHWYSLTLWLCALRIQISGSLCMHLSLSKHRWWVTLLKLRLEVPDFKQIAWCVLTSCFTVVIITIL